MLGVVSKQKILVSSPDLKRFGIACSFRGDYWGIDPFFTSTSRPSTVTPTEPKGNTYYTTSVACNNPHLAYLVVPFSVNASFALSIILPLDTGAKLYIVETEGNGGGGIWRLGSGLVGTCIL